MYSTIRVFGAVLALFFFSACSTESGNMAHMNQMKDSVFARYANIASVTINVENDNDLLVAVGSEDLYLADEATRQRVANEMTAMAMRIFGEKNKLEQGKLLVTKNEMNQDAQPADALVSTMDFKTAHGAVKH